MRIISFRDVDHRCNCMVQAKPTTLRWHVFRGGNSHARTWRTHRAGLPLVCASQPAITINDINAAPCCLSGWKLILWVETILEILRDTRITHGFEKYRILNDIDITQTRISTNNRPHTRPTLKNVNATVIIPRASVSAWSSSCVALS